MRNLPFTKLVLLVVASCAMATIVRGQSPASDKPRGRDQFGIFWTLPIDIPVIDYKNLNAALQSAGYPKCEEPALNFGLGVQWQFGNSLFWISYNGMRRTDTDTPNSEKLVVKYRAYNVGYGYDLIRHPGWSLYPYVGFKRCDIRYDFREIPAGALPFNSYLTQPLRYTEFSGSRMHADFGIGASQQWFYLVGLRTGVLVPLNKTRWDTNRDKTQLNDAPDLRFRYYLTVTLGLGGIDVFKSNRRQPDRDQPTPQGNLL